MREPTKLVKFGLPQFVMLSWMNNTGVVVEVLEAYQKEFIWDSVFVNRYTGPCLLNILGVISANLIIWNRILRHYTGRHWSWVSVGHLWQKTSLLYRKVSPMPISYCAKKRSSFRFFFLGSTIKYRHLTQAWGQIQKYSYVKVFKYFSKLFVFALVFDTYHMWSICINI